MIFLQLLQALLNNTLDSRLLRLLNFKKDTIFCENRRTNKIYLSIEPLLSFDKKNDKELG
jgi:hypothetical protein